MKLIQKVRTHTHMLTSRKKKKQKREKSRKRIKKRRRKKKFFLATLVQNSDCNPLIELVVEIFQQTDSLEESHYLTGVRTILVMYSWLALWVVVWDSIEEYVFSQKLYTSEYSNAYRQHLWSYFFPFLAFYMYFS